MRVETFISKYSKSSPTKVTFGIIKIIFLADPPTYRSPVGNPLPPSAMPALAVSIRPRTHTDREHPQRFASCINLHGQLSFN